MVEEVPRALIGERSGAMVKYAPERVVKAVVFLDVFFVAFGPEDFGA